MLTHGGSESNRDRPLAFTQILRSRCRVETEPPCVSMRTRTSGYLTEAPRQTNFGFFVDRALEVERHSSKIYETNPRSAGWKHHSKIRNEPKTSQLAVTAYIVQIVPYRIIVAILVM